MKSVILALMLTGSFSAMAADCNSKEVRRGLLQDYNEVLKENDAGVTVVDAYDQITEKQTENELQCLGKYDFSDGDTATVRYRAYLNSLGDPVVFFDPLE